MAGYARQSSSSIQDGETITAAPLNSEFDAVLAAFAFSGGHNHDGSSTEGAYVSILADVDALNKIVVDNANNRHGFFVEVSSSAVEQIRIQDGAIVPVTDSDIDLGTNLLEFKDLYIDGTAYVDTLEIHVGATLSAGVLSLPDGSASAPVITNTSDTNQGLYFSGTDEMSFTAGGTAQVTFADGVIKPVTDNDVDLGTASLQFKDIHINGTANIDTLAGTTMSGNLAMGSNLITGLAAPSADGDAARKVYVDDSIAAAEGLTQLAGNINVNGYFFFGSSGEDIKFKPVGSASILSTQDTDGEFVALVLRNESDAADTTGIASLRFDLEDTGGNTVDAAKIAVKKEASFTATAATQDSSMVFSTSLNGTLTEYLKLTSAGILEPITDDTVDIGTATKEIKNIYVDGTAYIDAIGFGTTSVALPGTDGTANQILKTNGSGTISWANDAGSSFVLEDDDGTEVTISADKEVKFIGSGVTTNWTDTDNGTDADPYDLTFTVDAAQTGITSVVNTSLVVGRDADNDIDFATDNTILFRAGAADQIKLVDGALLPVTDADIDLGSSSLQFKDAFIHGTLEADAITVNGTTLAVTIEDTAGALFSGNTETGITATYQAADNTIDLAINAAQTTVTSLLATDIKIGEDDETKIDFETANEIHLYANNAEQVYVADGIFGPETDSDVDLGTTGVRWKDAFIDTVTTTGALTVGGDLTVNGTTTTVNSTTVTIDDPIFTLGGDSAPGSDDNKDRGIEFRWHNGSAAKVGFFGYDDNAAAFTFIPDATNSSEVFSGTVGNAIFGNVTGTLQTAAQTNITSVGALDGGSITSNFGTIDTGASAITTTGLISGGSLDIDNVLINGTTIGHTDDTDLLTLANGALTVAGTIEGTTITASTSVVPDASGGADLGSTSLEWGDLYIADDKKIYLGSDQNFSIEYDEDGNDTTAVVAAGGVSLAPHGTGTGNGTELRFQELAANGANYVGFKGPDSISSNEVWVLPNADGTDGQFLKTDGSNALSWGSVASAGTTTLVADGAITNGQPVVVTSAGKAAQVAGNASRIGGVGSETVLYPTGQFNGTANNMSALTYDPDTDRFIYMTSDTADLSSTSSTKHTPISRVVTVDASKSISVGTAQRMNSNLSVNQQVESGGAPGTWSEGYYDTVANKVIQFVNLSGDGSGTAHGGDGWYYNYGTVTGGTTNTISWGTMTRVSPDGVVSGTARNSGPSSADGGTHFAAGTVSSVRYGVFAHKNTTGSHANNGDGSAQIGEMNTSTGAITWNTTAIIIDDSQNGRTLGMDVAFDTSAGKFLIQYTKGEETSGDRDIHIVVATPSGTGSSSTLSLGTPVELINEKTYGGNGNNTFLQYDEDLGVSVAFFINSGTSRLNGSVISIDGTTPTKTTPEQIINENVTEGGMSATKNTELSTSSTAIYEVLCKSANNEIYMINVEVTTSGVSASNTLGPRKFEIPSTSDSDADHYAHHVVHGSSTSTDNSCGILTIFGDGKAPNSDYSSSGANQTSRPTGIFRQTDVSFSTNLTTENYIGIANANYSDGATATIQIAGSIDDAQSSLTIGQIYYVKPAGGLDRVQGLPKVVAGVATSASTLAIAGPPTDPQVDSRVYIGSRDFRRETDENGNRNNATTFMIPANIPASQVVAYEIEIHNIGINGTDDNTYVYCQPLADDGSTSVMSNTWHAVNSYVLDTSYSSTAYDFTSSTGIPCMLGGKNYGLFNDNQDSFPQVDDTTDDTSSGLYSKCIYTQSNRYGTWNWDATWHGSSDATGGLVSLDKGHASTNGDASTTGFAHGFKIYAADSSGGVESSRYFTQGIVSVYAIVKSDLDRSGVSPTGGNEDFGG